METHALKLLAHTVCADVNARGGLDPAVIESAIRTIYGVTLFCYFRWSATVLLSYYASSLQ